MRTFFLLFCLTWLTGIALGVFTAPWFLLLSIAAGIAVILGRSTQSWPVKIAGLLLLLLGFVLGSSSNDPEISSACSIASRLTARLTAIERVEEKRTIYAATTADGCRILISAERFPILREGDSVEAAGKIQTTAEIAVQN